MVFWQSVKTGNSVANLSGAHATDAGPRFALGPKCGMRYRRDEVTVARSFL
jgi:hypothetical protein